MRIDLRRLAGAVTLTSLALSATSAALGQPGAPARTGMPSEDLKTAYLECERSAVSGRLPAGEIMMCSIIYEELKERAFDGDFTRWKAWADDQLHPPRSN